MLGSISSCNSYPGIHYPKHTSLLFSTPAELSRSVCSFTSQPMSALNRRREKKSVLRIDRRVILSRFGKIVFQDLNVEFHHVFLFPFFYCPALNFVLTRHRFFFCTTDLLAFASRQLHQVVSVRCPLSALYFDLSASYNERSGRGIAAHGARPCIIPVLHKMEKGVALGGCNVGRVYLLASSTFHTGGNPGKPGSKRV